MSLTADEIAGGWVYHDGSKTPAPHEFIQFTAYHPEFRYSQPTWANQWDWATIKAYRPLRPGDTTWPTRTCPAQIFSSPKDLRFS